MNTKSVILWFCLLCVGIALGLRGPAEIVTLKNTAEHQRGETIPASESGAAQVIDKSTDKVVESLSDYGKEVTAEAKDSGIKVGKDVKQVVVQAAKEIEALSDEIKEDVAGSEKKAEERPEKATDSK